MAKHIKNITANESVLIGVANKTAERDRYFATVSVIGGGGNNFGSGTVTIQYSPDNGTTKIDVLKPDESALTFTANGGRNVELGYGNSQNGIELYATMTGSTSPDVDVIVHDNAS